jgi:SAM-dependent methyltransferase
LRKRWRESVEGPNQVSAPDGAAVLDVGCGRFKYPGAIGIDRLESTDADVQHDLDLLPYPFEDGSFDTVIARHVLEHLEAPLEVLTELHRITRSGGIVTVITHHFSSRSFDYLVAGTNWDFYSAARFDVLDRSLTLGMIRGPRGRVVPIFRLLGVEAAVNRYLDVFERWWAFALPLGPKDLVLRLRVVK